jgi:dimeric dUTPase (all-alpha-NTP-PPase superfamily)
MAYNFIMKGRPCLMNLSEPYEMQFANSDNFIQGKTEKILALQVKIAELAKETNCFKNCPSVDCDRKALLAIYKDCLILTFYIGFDYQYRVDEIKEAAAASSLSSQFETLYVDINDFVVCSSLDHYTTLLEDFISLGTALKFTELEIRDAYSQININKLHMLK